MIVRKVNSANIIFVIYTSALSTATCQNIICQQSSYETTVCQSKTDEYMNEGKKKKKGKSVRVYLLTGGVWTGDSGVRSRGEKGSMTGS